jgi:hypothetical protein
MHQYVKTLENISGRYAPSRVLSFDIVHVFKALQPMKNRGLVSRDLLCQELDLREGTITLLKHLKMHDIIKSTIARTKLTCISVRFEYEWRDADNPNQWMRTHGNEHWEFDDNGLMRVRDMSANDYPI